MAPAFGPMCYPVQSAVDQNSRKPMNSSPPYSYSMGDVSMCPNAYSNPGMNPFGSDNNFEISRTQEEINLDPKYPWSNRKPEKKIIRMEDAYRNLGSPYNGMDWYPPAMSYSCPCGPFSQFGSFGSCKPLNPYMSMGPNNSFNPPGPCGPFNFCMPYGPCGPFDPYSPCGPYRSPSSPNFPSGPNAASCGPFGMCRPFNGPCGPLCSPVYGGCDRFGPRSGNGFMPRGPCPPYGDPYDSFYQTFGSPNPIPVPHAPARSASTAIPASGSSNSTSTTSYGSTSPGMSAGGRPSYDFKDSSSPKYEKTTYRVNVDLNA